MAEDLRDSGISIYAIGITDNIAGAVLRDITRRPERVFKLANYAALTDAFLNMLSAEVCHQVKHMQGKNRN